MTPSHKSEQPELALFTEGPPGHSIPRVFLGWERPVLASTVDFLAKDWKGRGSLDLSDHLIVVPTRNAGRRLRESLAVHAAKFDAAVIPPLVVTPDFLYAPARVAGTEFPVASPTLASFIWTGVLLELPLAKFRRVFPVDPVETHLKWANDNASEILKVRSLLIESDLDFADAADLLTGLDIEPGRWNELSAIESIALAMTRNCRHLDPGSVSREAALTGVLPPGIRKLVIAGVPDLKPLAIKALRHHSTTTSAEILIHAPASESLHFDLYGRALPSTWMTREIPIPSPSQTIRPCANATAQAEACRDLITGLPEPAKLVAIGIPDPEVAPALAQILADAGQGTYDPAGRALSREGLHHLLKQTHNLLATDRFDSFRLLLRCPGFIFAAVRYLPERASVSSGKVLRWFDELASETLPDRLGDALTATRKKSHRNPVLSHLITWTQSWMTRFQKEDFATVVTDYLTGIFFERRFSPHDPIGAVFSEVASAIHQSDRELELAKDAFRRDLGGEEKLALLLSVLTEQHLYPERGPGDIDLQGWLELLWEDAPHLIVTGMNDHAVPEAIIGHAFLPDSARRALGIQNNDDRFARDAYLLTTLIETRRGHGGRIDLLFGRQSASGDPLRPSRLLFQCEASALADRTLQLFSEESDVSTPLPRTIAWKLKPLPLPVDHRIFQRISVTDFKRYLSCPFRFYLEKGLRMEAVEPEKSELDPRDFGNLIHAALEALGRNESLRASTKPEEIASFFENEVDHWLKDRFGSRLPASLVIQREAARRRLATWAKIEARCRLDGWSILEVESPIGSEECPFIISDMPVSGRIDRIEQHEELGLRVFDFKTKARAEYGKLIPVDRCHLTTLKRGEIPEDFPGWALTHDDKGKPKRWVDLQVPLYCLALAARFPGMDVTAGYVTLGKTDDEIRLDLWDGLDEATIASARTCAGGVIDAIRQSIFWPPNEQMPKWDSFHELLSPSASATVDPTGLGATPDPV